LVVEGEKTNVPLDATREWVKAAPRARLLLIPNAGHFTLVEKPEALRDIGTFLGGKWPAAAKEINVSR
jgi:pimeloyl-ACP methyl ester carboxylesterase